MPGGGHGIACLLAIAATPGTAALLEPSPIPAIYRSDSGPSLQGWTPARAALGRRLFADTLLSRDRTISCRSCHDPARAFTDGRTLAVGVGGRKGKRNTPTLINRALGEAFFWDGRSGTLAEQARGPIENPLEMALPIDEAVRRLAGDSRYRRAFLEAFERAPSPETLGAALAAYEQTIFSTASPFDRFIAGDPGALSPAAHRGLALFGGKAGCGACHAGTNFTDEAYHALGVGDDEGRAAITRDPSDRGAFKTPTLREVARTAPYMHDGSLATLREVIEYYDRGGSGKADVDPRVRPLGLTAEDKEDLLAFLESLSGTIVEGPAPTEVPQASLPRRAGGARAGGRGR